MREARTFSRLGTGRCLDYHVQNEHGWGEPSAGPTPSERSERVGGGPRGARSRLRRSARRGEPDGIESTERSAAVWPLGGARGAFFVQYFYNW
jgi:hypothetical protein